MCGKMALVGLPAYHLWQVAVVARWAYESLCYRTEPAHPGSAAKGQQHAELQEATA